MTYQEAEFVQESFTNERKYKRDKTNPLKDFFKFGRHNFRYMVHWEKTAYYSKKNPGLPGIIIFLIVYYSDLIVPIKLLPGLFQT